MINRPHSLFIGTFVLFLFLTAPAISSAAAIFTRPLYIGTHGPDVSTLQQYLRTQGYFAYPTITGLYGTFTYKAVAAFQTANHLEAVGNVGPLTRALLNTSLASTSTPSAVLPIATSTTTPPLFNTRPLPGYAPGQIIFIGGGGSPTTPATIPDTTAPTVSLTAPTNGATVAGTSVTLAATASDNVGVTGVQFKVDGTNVGSSGTTSPYSISWNSTSASDGPHTIAAVAHDAALNYATSSVNVIVDNTPPVISSISSGTPLATSTSIVWTTNEAATSEVVLGTTTAYGSAISSSTLVTSHSLALAGLTASTTYDYAVVSTDGVGNTATSSNHTFTTQAGLFGVVIAGPENYSAPVGYSSEFPTTADWNYLQSKGIQTVALTIAWENLQHSLGGSLDSTFLGLIQSAIAAAHSHNIGVIVRIQNYGFYANSTAWGSTVFSAGNAGQTGSNVYRFGDGTLTSSTFADVWTKLSTALVGTPGLIGYDLMNEPNPIATNLFCAPDAFGDTSTIFSNTCNWYTFGTVNSVTQLAVGTNPISSSYAPAWALNSSNFGAVSQFVTLANTPYTLSVYAKTNSGTIPLTLNIGGSHNTQVTVTTSWQRFTFTATPPAGGDNVYFQINNGSANQVVDLANAQLETGSSASAYQPNPYLTYAQAAVTAIRAVDTATPIYVQGYETGYATNWPQYNWDMLSLTGGNLIFEAHDYFDGPEGFGDGGTYGGTYSSYSIDTQSGVNIVTPFVQWLQTVGAKGQVGEFGVPNSNSDNNAQWLVLQQNFLKYLYQNNVPATMEFYGANNAGFGSVLQINPQGGVDDPRLVQMTAVSP